MIDYHFPDESQLFLSAPYTDAMDEAKARTTAILAKSYGQAAAILLLSGIVSFSLGIGIAAIVDRGWENIQNTRIANVEQ